MIMKVRHGFVSNSSTTSFLIDCRQLDLNTIEEALDGVIMVYKQLHQSDIDKDMCYWILHPDSEDYIRRFREAVRNVSIPDDLYSHGMIVTLNEESMSWSLAGLLRSLVNGVSVVSLGR
jgi:hypothetical protein